jgi:hypothetical protein
MTKKFLLLLFACVSIPCVFATGRCECQVKTETEIVFDNVSFDANTGRGSYVKTEGYRYINIYVAPVTKSEGDTIPYVLGVVFNYDEVGTVFGARSLYNFESDPSGDFSPHFFSLQAERNCAARLPVMAPYAHIVVYNRTNSIQHFTVWTYLTQ